jgi:integrase
MESRPVPTLVMAGLRKFVNESSAKQIRLFNNNLSHNRWRKIGGNAGLADLKFHDLRKAFDSMLAQNGISTAVTQKLLEHYSPILTNKVYMNVDTVLRHAVD